MSDRRGECGPNLKAEIGGGKSWTAASKDTKAMGAETPVVSREIVDGLGRVKDSTPVNRLENLPSGKHFESQHGSGT
jgi:hypothetical protein